MNQSPDFALVRTDVPARLDGLPWSRFHTLVVVALGVTWILDGLEVTIAGSIAAALKEDPAMAFTEAQIGLASSAYLFGAALMIGAAVIVYFFAVAAERKSLEEVARPLSAAD